MGFFRPNEKSQTQIYQSYILVFFQTFWTRDSSLEVCNCHSSINYQSPVLRLKLGFGQFNGTVWTYFFPIESIQKKNNNRAQKRTVWNGIHNQHSVFSTPTTLFCICCIMRNDKCELRSILDLNPIMWLRLQVYVLSWKMSRK